METLYQHNMETLYQHIMENTQKLDCALVLRALTLTLYLSTEQDRRKRSLSTAGCVSAPWVRRARMHSISPKMLTVRPYFVGTSPRRVSCWLAGPGTARAQDMR